MNHIALTGDQTQCGVWVMDGKRSPMRKAHFDVYEVLVLGP